MLGHQSSQGAKRFLDTSDLLTLSALNGPMWLTHPIVSHVFPYPASRSASQRFDLQLAIAQVTIV